MWFTLKFYQNANQENVISGITYWNPYWIISFSISLLFLIFFQWVHSTFIIFSINDEWLEELLVGIGPNYFKINLQSKIQTD